MGGAFDAQATLAFRGTVGAGKGVAGGFFQAPRRGTRDRHECRPGADVDGSTLLDRVSRAGYGVLYRGGADRARHAPAHLVRACAPRAAQFLRSRISAAVGRGGASLSLPSKCLASCAMVG